MQRTVLSQAFRSISNGGYRLQLLPTFTSGWKPLGRHLFSSQLIRSYSGLTRRLKVDSRCGQSPSLLILRSASVEFCPPKTLERLRHKDEMPPSYTLIYRSSFVNYLIGAQITVVLALLSFFGTLVKFVDEQIKSVEEVERQKELRKEEVLELKRIKEEGDMAIKLKEFREEHGFEDYPGRPDHIDLLDDDSALVRVALAFSVLALGITTFRLMKTMPMRIYVNDKKHCFAITYGHVIPGKTSDFEFVSGTLKKLKGWMQFDCVYQDGTGRKMILLEQHFRYPGDLNNLMGIGEEFAAEEMHRKLKKQRRDISRE